MIRFEIRLELKDLTPSQQLNWLINELREKSQVILNNNAGEFSVTEKKIFIELLIDLVSH